MNTALLRYARELAACGSMQKTAERLGMDRTSVSRNIKRLEEELGVPLFFHAPGGIVPTQYGDIFLQRAEEILQEEDDLRFDFAGEENYTGVLRLGMGINRSSRFVPLILPEFHRRYPRMTVRFLEMKSSDMCVRLLGGHLDFAITYFPANDEITFEPLMDEHLVLVAAREDGYPKAHMREENGQCFVDLAAFREKPFILGDAEQKSRRVCDAVFRQLAIEPLVVLESPYCKTTLTLVSRGMGYALAPSTNVDPEQDGVSVYALDPALATGWTLGIAWLKNKRLSHASAQFKQVLSALLAKPPYAAGDQME